MAIIAPTWEIIDNGNEENRILNFSGNDAESMARAANSTKHYDNETPIEFRKRAKDGKTGNPGESGGQFIAIGRSITGKPHIDVFVNGGRGGNGQDGGHGLYFIDLKTFFIFICILKYQIIHRS